MDPVLGYMLASEEHRPQDLIRYAQGAEAAGFEFAAISDHYHPWTNEQGQSGFVWGVIGAISQVTSSLTIGTGVTCPTYRIHPAIIAQAAATAASLLPGRFFLGVGSGEYLNEHILGDAWPPAGVRIERLEEAIAVMRELWKGGYVDHRGKYFTLDSARIYSLPEEEPPVMVAATGSTSTDLAIRVGDGLINSSAAPDSVQRFTSNGHPPKPTFGQMSVCWARSDEEALRTAREWWPNAAIPGPLMSELKIPDLYGAVSSLLTNEQVAKSFVLGPDPERYVTAIRDYASMGYDHVYLHNVGPDQEEFFQFFEREVQPHFG